MAGLIAAAALIGILIGSPIGGWAADKWGRKPIFMFDIGLFAIASGMQFFVDSPALLIVVRLLMGIAIGTEYAVGWPLMAEFSPTHLRGRLMAAMGIAWYGGFMIAFLIGHLLNEYTDLSWHFILGTSTFIAVAIFLARLGMPESPRWLWSVGRKDEARALAAKYMPDDALDDVQHEDVRKGSFGMLFSKEHWRSTLFISAFWFCAVTPYFAIATFADSVLNQYGLAGGLAGGVGLSAVALAGVVVTFLLIDKAGRRILTRPAAVAVRRRPRDHRPVGRRAGARRAHPVPGLLVLQRDVQHVDERLPGRGPPDRDPRDRNRFRGRRQPRRGRHRHLPLPDVDGDPRGRSHHADRRRSRPRRCRAIPVAGSGDEGKDPHRGSSRLLALSRSSTGKSLVTRGAAVVLRLPSFPEWKRPEP